MSTAGARDGVGDVRVGALAATPPGAAPTAQVGKAAGDGSTGARWSPWRTVVAGLLALMFLLVAGIAAGRGIITDTWPAFLPGTDSTSITRYSGPWLTVAAAAVLGAGLSIMALVRGLTVRPRER
ncbi:hypothetical protein [Nakamurella sp.]|uniref:hypothetical protein n=1 Tax=Nakamurella sp. TaxID=1869182 RepID=UPI003783B2D9